MTTFEAALTAGKPRHVQSITGSACLPGLSEGERKGAFIVTQNEYDMNNMIPFSRMNTV